VLVRGYDRECTSRSVVVRCPAVFPQILRLPPSRSFHKEVLWQPLRDKVLLEIPAAPTLVEFFFCWSSVFSAFLMGERWCEVAIPPT